jgi:beta-lactamase class A
MRIKIKPTKSLDKNNKDQNNSEEEEIKNTKNRKKKKEPPKPWGKLERFLVLFFLLSTTLSSAALAFSARKGKIPGLPHLKMPDLSMQQTYVIEANPTKDQDFKAIEDEFIKATNHLSGIYGFYVIRLYDNVAYGVNENRIFQAASLIKLPVIATLYMDFDNQKLNPNTTYSLKESDKIGGAGSLYYKDTGTKVTYQELATLMANQSDNTAFHIARNILGDDQINNTIRIFGMTNTDLENNKTTPKDIGIFFKNLYRDTLVSDKYRTQFISDLTHTSFEDHLPAGVPQDIKVAHKYGREVHVVADGGIVFTQEPYIVVIMSDGVVEQEADAAFPVLSELIYEYETTH